MMFRVRARDDEREARGAGEPGGGLPQGLAVQAGGHRDLPRGQEQDAVHHQDRAGGGLHIPVHPRGNIIDKFLNMSINYFGLWIQ